jgi:predicted porin
MKKTWVALAVAGAFAAGAAQAQSSVTLYGIVDVNYMWQELPTSVGTPAAPRISQESFSAINSGHQSGSRWGLRGSEDLGGGLKAIFTLEGGYSPDTGTLGQGGRLFGRQAWAGLQGGWGAVVLGRLATFSSGTGSFDMFGRTDPFLTGFGLASLGNTFYSANALRVDNAIAYQSPKWAGFRGGIGYTTRIDGNEVAPSGNNADAIIAAINWEAGPFWVSVTYDSIDNPTGGSDQKHLQVGATFDLGPVRLHGGYADQSNIGAIPDAPTGGTGSFLVLPAGFKPFDTSAYMLGATWTIGAFKVFGSWQMQDADSQTGPDRSFDPDFDIWALGGSYNLSRRTNLYASYAQRNADGTFQSDSFDAKQFAVGVRHLF